EHLRLAREFADKRVPENGMNRLYVAEPTFTVTGSMADHRLPVRAADVLNVGRALAQALASSTPELAELGGAHGLSPKAQEWVRAVAADLAHTRGQCLVIAGFRQSPAVHALAHAINSALGNIGTTVHFSPSPLLDADDGVKELRALAEE